MADAKPLPSPQPKSRTPLYANFARDGTVRKLCSCKPRGRSTFSSSSMPRVRSIKNKIVDSVELESSTLDHQTHLFAFLLGIDKLALPSKAMDSFCSQSVRFQKAANGRFLTPLG
jgi:hypothetical protein